MMYDELVKRLRRHCRWYGKECEDCDPDGNCRSRMENEAADAIEELSAKFVAEHELRVKALNRLCSWCGVCSKENRNAVGCDDIAQLDEVNAPRWISVKERLPENDDFVIVAVLDEHGDTPYKYSDFGWYFEATKVWIVDNERRTDITHWMPLPEPPKEDV